MDIHREHDSCVSMAKKYGGGTAFEFCYMFSILHVFGHCSL